MFDISQFIVTLFGIFLIFASFLMFFSPEKVRNIIAKAGSTYLINYSELLIRFIVGLAFLNSAIFSTYGSYLELIGEFLMITAVLLMFVPIKLHNKFAKNAADRLKPFYLKLVAPISLFLGIFLIRAIKIGYINF
ncbi:hypothetical protein [uncultured Flavobacterium sp.]|uniref:hypothetical protein n=1 Tax=uncultured Flavobacterium sp. TaxID=165435 RepID=UPI0030EC55AE|tara:strand:- start:250878 stop:251282 length:405 start_codon:yes stop_codon:yes gene_type:complete